MQHGCPHPLCRSCPSRRTGRPWPSLLSRVSACPRCTSVGKEGWVKGVRVGGGGGGGEERRERCPNYTVHCGYSMALQELGFSDSIRIITVTTTTTTATSIIMIIIIIRRELSEYLVHANRTPPSVTILRRKVPVSYCKFYTLSSVLAELFSLRCFPPPPPTPM